MAIGITVCTPTTPWTNSTAYPATQTITGLNGGTNFPANSKLILFIAFTGYNETSGHPVILIGGSGGTAATFIGYDGNDDFLYCYYLDVGGSSIADSVYFGFQIGHWIGVQAYILTGAAAGFTATYGTNFESLQTEHGNFNADPIGPQNYNATYDGGSDGTLNAIRSITVPAGGIGIVAAQPNGGTPTPAWTTGGSSNITAAGGDATRNHAVADISQLVTAHTITAGSWAPALTGTSPTYQSLGATGMVAIAFAAAAGVAFQLGTAVQTNGINAFALANKIHILSEAPPTPAYSDITSITLGNMNFGIGNCFGAVTDYSGPPPGNQISSTAITSGSVTANGTPACWAVVDDANSRLLAWDDRRGGGDDRQFLDPRKFHHPGAGTINGRRAHTI
jgi:hypothetical protein